MSEKSEDSSKEKILKLTKVLKDLEDKYKKIHKDRTSLISFIKTTLPASLELNAQLDCAPGLIDQEKLNEIKKLSDNEKQRENPEIEQFKKKITELGLENIGLQEKIDNLKLNLDQEKKKSEKLEQEKTDQFKKQVNEGANLLLSKLKNVGNIGSGTTLVKINDEKKEKENLEQKISEQTNLILSLQTQLNDAKNELKKSGSIGKNNIQEISIQTEQNNEIQKESCIFVF